MNCCTSFTLQTYNLIFTELLSSLSSLTYENASLLTTRFITIVALSIVLSDSVELKFTVDLALYTFFRF